MALRQPPTQTLTLADVTERLDDLAAAVSRGETRILVEQDGVVVAALVSPGDLDTLIAAGTNASLPTAAAPGAAAQAETSPAGGDPADEDEKLILFAPLPPGYQDRPVDLSRMTPEAAALYTEIQEFAAGFDDIPLAELEREINKAIAEVRAEMREERLNAAAEAEPATTDAA